MNRRAFLTLLVMAALCATTVVGVPADKLVDCVNPLIGAVTYPEGGMRGQEGVHGFGKTFPGAATPFGMVQLSPDTVTGGDNGSGYSYCHGTIEGFSMTHLSGIGWYGDLGNFQVMPADGPARFSHANEVAKAGYYSVELDEPKVRVSLTADPGQCGIYKFTYPKSEKSVLKIDLARRIGELSRAKRFSRQTVSMEDDRTISGSIWCDHRDGGWGRGKGGVDYTLYFYAKFLATCEHSLKDAVVTGAPSNTVLRLEFPTHEGEQVFLRVWISYESVEKARRLCQAWEKNCRRECLPVGYQWFDVFDRIEVEGGTDRERRIFATALYHACLDPRKIDLPGQSRTVFSGWDVYRSEMPFLTLIFPEVVTDTVNAMMGVMESGKRDTLPVWDLFGCPSSCMIGNPLIPVIATAQEAGLGGIDYAKALDLAVKTTEERGNLACGYTPGSLSATLEYCYDDWCVAEIARRLGKREIAGRFASRANWYTNCWDGSVGWMRARTADGGWLPWRGRETDGQGCVEANPWQQGWFVPHDPEGLVRLMGGGDRFTEELERFFSAVPDDFRWNPAYNHPNEPCHTLPFLWAFSSRPEEMSRWTRKILAQAYGEGPFGLCGNEDVGQMSAWYVLAAIGLNPLCPGDGRWYVTAPIFRKTVLRLDQRYYSGKAFTIVAPNAGPEAWRIRGVKLNGRPIDRIWIATREVTSGGTLEIDLCSDKEHIK